MDDSKNDLICDDFIEGAYHVLAYHVVSNMSAPQRIKIK